MLSNDNISTELSDRLYFSENITRLKPKKSRILSPGTKLKISSSLEISMILPTAEKIGFTVNG